MSKLQVSIVILTYNSEKYVNRLVKSIFEFNDEEKIEIIIADNKSEDATVRGVKKEFGNKVKIVQNGENLGFGRGVNAAAKYARGEFLLFVNPDAEWVKGSADDMMEVFDNNLGVGIVGGKMMTSANKPEKSAGKFFSLMPSIALAAGLDELIGVRFSPGITRKVDFVSGGFMMIRRSLFEKLRGFDERFFMYIEDMELCFRAKLAGYSTFFTPNVTLKHMGQGSSDRSFAIKNIYRGIKYFHKKHGTAFSYQGVRGVLTLKAVSLVVLGKILNNKYLTKSYMGALKA